MKNLCQIKGSFFHNSVSVITARFARAQTQINQGLIEAERFGKVFGTFPLDVVRFKIKTYDVARARKGLRDYRDPIVSKFIDA